MVWEQEIQTFKLKKTLEKEVTGPLWFLRLKCNNLILLLEIKNNLLLIMILKN